MFYFRLFVLCIILYILFLYTIQFYFLCHYILLLSSAMIVQKKAGTAGFFRSLIPVYMILVCLKLEDLISVDTVALSMTFHSQLTFCDSQIFPCLFAMASADIEPARFHLDPVDFHKSCIFVWQTGPYPVLTFQFFGRKQVLWCHKTAVHPRRLDQFLKFDPETACDLAKYSERGIRCPSLDLCQHALADTGLLCDLVKTHAFGFADSF